MSNVSLGGSKNKQNQEKQKMIYMNVPTALSMIIDSDGIDVMTKYTNAMIQSISNSYSNSELRKVILETFGVKTVKKMERLKEREYEILTKIFGKKIWGHQETE